MTELAFRPELLRESELLEFVRGSAGSAPSRSTSPACGSSTRRRCGAEPPALVDTLVEVRYPAGTHDLYQMIVGVREEGASEGDEIAAADGLTSYDAFADLAFARELMNRLRDGTTAPAGDGTIEFSGMSGLPFGTAPPIEARALGVEQSNSSIVLDDTLIVKLYRRIEAGVNPEVELLHFFSERGFENVPKLRGWWSYAGTLMNASLGVVQQFAPSSVDGWSLALEELGSDPETFTRRLRRLGEVIGQMHTVLASEPDNPAFAPEEASQESLALLTATVDDQIDQVFLSLPEGNPAVEPIAGRADDVRDLLRGLSTVGSIGLRIRTHGDLHLGQLLWSQDDWLVIDFEGEPARPLPERRLKQSPLRDVAGLLRSFSYAASVAGIDALDLETSARAEFLDGYMPRPCRTRASCPPYATTARLLRIFELEKAVYELRYEIAHRPDWVPIPVAPSCACSRHSA